MVLKDLFEKHLSQCNDGPRMAELALRLADKLICPQEALVIFENGTCLDMEEPDSRDPAALAAYACDKVRGREAEDYLNYLPLPELTALYFPLTMDSHALELAVEEMNDWQQEDMRRAIAQCQDRVFMLRDEWDWAATEFTFNLAVENTVAADEFELSGATIAFFNRKLDFAEPKVKWVVTGGVVTAF